MRRSINSLLCFVTPIRHAMEMFDPRSLPSAPGPDLDAYNFRAKEIHRNTVMPRCPVSLLLPQCIKHDLCHYLYFFPRQHRDASRHLMSVLSSVMSIIAVKAGLHLLPRSQLGMIQRDTGRSEKSLRAVILQRHRHHFPSQIEIPS